MNGLKIVVIRDNLFSNNELIEEFIKNIRKSFNKFSFIDKFKDLEKTDVSKLDFIVCFLSKQKKNEIKSLLKLLSGNKCKLLIISDYNYKKTPDYLANNTNVEIINSKNIAADSLAVFFNYFIKINNQKNGQKKNQYNFNLEKIFNNSGVGVLLSDFHGKIIKCNNTLCSMLEYTENEIYSMTLVGLTYKDDKSKTQKLFEKLVNGKKGHYSFEKRYEGKDGKIVWVDVTVTIIKDEENKLEYVLVLAVDISKQKKIEDNLEKIQDLSVTLMDNTPDSIYFKDLKSNFIKVNKSAVKKLGFKKEKDMIGKSDFDIFTKEHAQIAFEDEQKIINTGKQLVGIEEKETWPDGRITYASTTKLPLKDSKGKIIGTFGITRDITRQKEAEINLAKEKERAELINRLIPSGIFTVDNNQIITNWNVRAEEITGYKHEEVVGKHCNIFTNTPCVNTCGLFKGNSNKAIIDVKCEIKTKDGRFLSISKNVDYLKDENGNIIGGIESFEDITERKEYEEIQKAQYQISEAVNTTPNITTLYKKIHDVVRGLMHAENFYIALFDEKTETLTFPYFVDEHDRTPEPRKLSKGLTEYVLRTGIDVLVDREKDKELGLNGEIELFGEMQSIWLGVPLKIGDKVIGVMAVQDYVNSKVYGEKERQILLFVSEQIAIAIEKKRSSDALEKYSEELKQLNITKDKFFSIIAHDLKNPFITLLGFSDMLVHDFDELTNKEKLAFITDIRNSAKSSHELLENLLDWSRSQTGRLEYRPHQFDIYELVKRNILLLNPMAKTKSIELICEVEETTGVFGDYEMINTVIRNLISNAVKFTNKNGRIRVYTENKNDFLKLCVEDNGVGMNKETQENLFILGGQRLSKGTSKEKGTGLGLILCKEFVEKNHGEINAKSEIGKGTTFCFTIPAVKILKNWNYNVMEPVQAFHA